ncbi:MAG: ATP-binding protein, partial [Bacteroidetes bacterium]|nr:ATP-binding protein [Bacteroidota bacterium]
VISETKYRISKYANFVARVIYDMKWYNPPLHTLRSQHFKTNLNEVLKFIVKSIFQRTSNPVKAVEYNFNFDDRFPPLPINEFVIWEIFEPLIQNSIDHSDKETTIITISTKYNHDDKTSVVTIDDNGPGIQGGLLEVDESGVKRIFLESTSTKTEDRHHGYGCYLAYEISRRCGWLLDAENLSGGGCRFILRISNSTEAKR